MFDVRKPEQKQIAVVRTACGQELSNYEKQKLASIEEHAQENKIETISVNGKRLQINSDTKSIDIPLGSIALSDFIVPEQISDDSVFFIECELDEEAIKNIKV
jgi:hypothetical protein